MWEVDPAPCALWTLLTQPLQAFCLPRRAPDFFGSGVGSVSLALLAGLAFLKLAEYERRQGWAWFLGALVPALLLPYPKVSILLWCLVLFGYMGYRNFRERDRRQQ